MALLLHDWSRNIDIELLQTDRAMPSIAPNIKACQGTISQRPCQLSFKDCPQRLPRKRLLALQDGIQQLVTVGAAAQIEGAKHMA